MSGHVFIYFMFMLSTVVQSDDSLKSAAPDTAKAQFEAIVKQHDENLRVYGAKIKAARISETEFNDKEFEKAADEYTTKVGHTSERAIELARVFPNEPTAIDALCFVLHTSKVGPGKHSEMAVDVLSDKHVVSKEAGRACHALVTFTHLPAAESFIRQVLQGNPSQDEQGRACLALARYLRYQAS
ncbi:MAG: hypothetical protein HZA46_11100 [Planctomycetales bacterium]|nr:hypothetical protein [Planctomycetales bacterium]